MEHEDIKLYREEMHKLGYNNLRVIFKGDFPIHNKEKRNPMKHLTPKKKKRK